MSKDEKIVDSLFRARKWAEDRRKYELEISSNDIRPWAVYESGLDKYNGRFFDLDLHGDFLFQDIVDRWESKGLILEAFGEGTLIRDLTRFENISNESDSKIAGGVAVSLADIRTEGQRNFDFTNQISFVEGDLYLGITYRKILEQLKETEFSGFKLIVCYPLGGWDIGEMGQNPPVHLVWIILRRLYDLLEENGELYVITPDVLIHNAVEVDLFKSVGFWDQWIEMCRKVDIEVKRGYGGTLKVAKKSKNKLPRFPVSLLEPRSK